MPQKTYIEVITTPKIVNTTNSTNKVIKITKCNTSRGKYYFKKLDKNQNTFDTFNCSSIKNLKICVKNVLW